MTQDEDLGRSPSRSPLEDSLIYRGASRFQRRIYEHAARYFYDRGIRRYGLSVNGNAYAHLLHPDDYRHNFISPIVADAVAARFDSHKAGDPDRTKTNTVASQPSCFNLFVPLAQDLPLASAVFSVLMGQQIAVDHIELEFTPNQLRDLPGYQLGNGDESLGDQREDRGTDADLAVFYRSGIERGILLVEFKYIENEFSTCSSYHSKNAVRRGPLRLVCDSPEFVPMVTELRPAQPRQPRCGYTKYENWNLTRRSGVLDWPKVTTLSECPFAGSGQQLWRNMLLAEKVADRRGLQQYAFWVVSPQGNDTLWMENGADVFEEFAAVLRPDERHRFRRMSTETVLETIRGLLAPGDDRHGWWVQGFRERYLPAWG